MGVDIGVIGDLANLRTGEAIEVLRDVPGRQSMAASALVAAYDDSRPLVKMPPCRVATLRVRCRKGEPVALTQINPTLAMEMMTKLIEDENVQSVQMVVETTPDDLT